MPGCHIFICRKHWQQKLLNVCKLHEDLFQHSLCHTVPLDMSLVLLICDRLSNTKKQLYYLCNSHICDKLTITKHAYFLKL